MQKMHTHIIYVYTCIQLNLKNTGRNPAETQSIPLNADWSVKFEEDIVSCSRSDCPEEVFSQVCLLQCVPLVHLKDT